MAIKHLGRAVFIDEDPITPSDWLESRKGKRKIAKRWGGPTLRALEWLEDAAEEGKRVAIHPWVEFPSLERAYVGVALLVNGKVEDSITLKEIPYFEPMARYTPSDLIDSELKDAKSWMFEESPYVEVTDEEDWKALLEAHESAYKREDAEERYSYDGPGLYDARDMSKSYDSVEDYEISEFEYQAKDLIEYMFSGGLMGSDLRGDEWVDAFEKLARQAADEEEEGEED